ncbi:hypothetical protein JCM10212_006588 [Sporobolomyces blumeae]
MPPPRRKHPIRKPPPSTSTSSPAAAKLAERKAARDAIANNQLLIDQILQSDAPQAVKDFFTRPDYRRDLTGWNMVYEAYLAHLWGPDTTNKRIDLDKPRDYDAWISPPAVRNRETKRRNVRDYAQKLSEIVLRAELKHKSLLDKWKALRDSEREDEFYRAIKVMTDNQSEASQTRNEVPEITLSRMSSNGGQGFVDLVNHFVDAYKRHISDDADLFVPMRHEVWERVYLMDRESGKENDELPEGIRAFQEEMLLDRHLYMILFSVSILCKLDGIEMKVTRPSSSSAVDALDVQGKLNLNDSATAAEVPDPKSKMDARLASVRQHPLTPGLVRQLGDFTSEAVYHVYYTSPLTGVESKQPLTFRSNPDALKSFLPIRNLAIQARDDRACGLLCAILLEGTVDDFVEGGQVTEQMVAEQMKRDFGWTQDQLDELVPPAHVLVQLDVVPDLPERVRDAEAGGNVVARPRVTAGGEGGSHGCGGDTACSHEH